MIKIQLDNPEAAFIPGQAIEGGIVWNDLPEKAERFEIRLIWYTRGKGDRDCEIVDHQLVADPGLEGNARFKFIAPTRPYSFSGKLVSLIWAIEAVAFPGLEAEQVEFVVSNSGKEIVLDGG